ncbi:SDR family NAD(P)-dependent oxidoreductase [Glaciibacter superstes]|uniref:SDR family NAD(P)-dependent oxidoreductase n=1 Tax=Glaciibacter superstes TaxID=501023 RepID=UPI0003B4F37A|nr:SDR family NAD(P)-dependent oxidoreductase [Glaciibacter superstes]
MTWDPDQLPDQTGRTVAVTGATAGIGYFAAEQLAGAGAHVVLASRNAAKLEVAKEAIREQVPGASLSAVVIDLTSLTSVARAAEELAALPRLDGILLNGGMVTMRRGETTADGLPLMMGSHVASNFALVAGILPTLGETGREHGTSARIVHTSTGFVRRFAFEVDDLMRTPRMSIAAYTHAKTANEIYAFELDRRLRAAELPVASIVTIPGVGVDAKTPSRAGIRDAATPYQRNPYTPWAQGKDTAAWSAVRGLTDPDAQGGEYYGPTGALRGQPTRRDALVRTAAPEGDLATRVWNQLEELAAIRVPVG